MTDLSKYDEKINAYAEKLRQAKEQKKLAENREKKKRKEQERKDETRRKIVLGALYIQRMRKDEQFNEQIMNWLDKVLTKTRDRKLFGLPETSEKTSENL